MTRVNSNSGTGPLRCPVRHRDAVGHVGEAEANRTSLGAHGANAGVMASSIGQRDDGPHSLEKASARQVCARNNHGVVLAVLAALRDWKGRLLTISRISPENRYSCSGSRLTIPLTVRLS